MKKYKTRVGVFALVALILVASIMFVSSESIVNANAANIVKGDTSSNITLVQTRLSELSYYTYTVDGIWGSRTLAAVKAFQKDYGLTVDGIVGANTEKALGITLTSSSSTGSYNTSSIDLLARCVYAEARGEPYSGQVAVAAVVLNRVASSTFPDTVSGVIYQPLAFTCVSDGQINLSADDSAYNAARDAINGADPSYGCLYYYNPATATSKWIWSLKVAITIGSHSFAYGV